MQKQILKIKDQLQTLLGELSVDELLRNTEMVKHVEAVFEELKELEVC